VLEGPNNILIEKSLHFSFKTSNNQAEYEAILAGLSLAREVGVKSLTCKTDSKLTVGHLNDEFQIKDSTLLQYYPLVWKVVQSAFEQVRIQHIPRSENVRADTSITSTCHNLTQHQADSWATPYIQYLQTSNPPPNANKIWITKVARYTMLGDDLYKRGYGQPLLKCVTADQA